MDVTSRESFNNLNKWFEKIDRYAMEFTKVLIVATKCDYPSKRQVSSEEIADLVNQIAQNESHKERALQFIEIEVMTETSVVQTVQIMLRTLMTEILLQEDKKALSAQTNKKKNNKRCIIM